MEQPIPELMTYSEFVSSRFKSAEATVMDILLVSEKEAVFAHAAIGLQGELVELLLSSDSANTLEELGDAWFFSEALRQQYKLQPVVYEGHSVRSFSSSLEMALGHANQLQDYAKRALIYRKGMPDAEIVIQHLEAINKLLQQLMQTHGISLDSVIAFNVLKLTKRYKKGYSNDAAQQRADKPAGE